MFRFRLLDKRNVPFPSIKSKNIYFSQKIFFIPFFNYSVLENFVSVF